MSENVCLEHGLNHEQMEVIGCPRYDELFSKREEKDGNYILILTSGLPSTVYSYFFSTSVILNFEKLMEKDIQHKMKS